MNTSLTIKWIDVAGQALMLFPLVAPLNGAWNPLESIGGNCVLQTCFSVGGWQVLSLLLHLLADPGGRLRRAAYSRVLAIGALTSGAALLCLTLGRALNLRDLGQFGGGLLIVLMAVLLPAAPVLAGWYFAICAGELRQHRSAIAHRREIHWKL